MKYKPPAFWASLKFSDKNQGILIILYDLKTCITFAFSFPEQCSNVLLFEHSFKHTKRFVREIYQYMYYTYFALAN